METVRGPYVIDRVDADGYEPDIIDGIQVGEFHGLEPEAETGSQLEVGLWRSEPATYDYLFESDEAFHVVEGAATIELPDTDERIEVKAGDIAYFRAGTRSVWTITQSFTKFVVIAA